LRLAEEFSDDASFLLQHGRHRSAVDRAYFSAYHAAAALSRNIGLESPCCDDYAHLVESWEQVDAFERGLVDREAPGLLRDLWEAREAAVASVHSSINPDAATDLVQDALLFVAQMQHRLTKERAHN
jgi:uncharacterized protein (UPF0332 family)